MKKKIQSIFKWKPNKKTLFRLKYEIFVFQAAAQLILLKAEIVEVLEINEMPFEGDPYAPTMEFTLMTSVGIVKTRCNLLEYANQV